MVIVDVREPEEFAEGHVAMAWNVPLAVLKEVGLPEVSKDELIIVYCRSGKRAGEAEATLRAMGFKRVTNCINQQEAETFVARQQG